MLDYIGKQRSSKHLLANNCTYVNAIGTVGNVSITFFEQIFPPIELRGIFQDCRAHQTPPFNLLP